MTNSLLLKMTQSKQWIFPLKMVIFHSYVNVYQRVSKADWWCFYVDALTPWPSLTSAPDSGSLGQAERTCKIRGGLVPVPCPIYVADVRFLLLSRLLYVAWCCFLEFRMSSLWVSEFCSLVVTDPMTHSANSRLRRWTFSDAQPIYIYNDIVYIYIYIYLYMHWAALAREQWVFCPAPPWSNLSILIWRSSSWRKPSSTLERKNNGESESA